MAHSLWTLIKLQLSEKLHWKQNASRGYKIASVAKQIAYMGIAFGIFAAILYIFKLMSFSGSVGLFTAFIAILQLISIVTCIVQSSNILYTSKDNALLLTYPVKHEIVYTSKILVIYIIELLKSLTLVFPLFMAYGIINSTLSANYVISGVFYSVLLPLIPVLLGAILSIPFVYLTKIFKQANWVKGIFSILLFTGLTWVTVLLVRVIQNNSPIRIVALFNTFQENINQILATFNKYTLYANFVGKGMLGADAATIWTNHGLMLAVIVGISAISILISMPTFFKLASSASENAATKKHKGTNKAHSNTFVTFIRKELTLALRNIGNFASDYVFLFAMPFVLILLSSIFVNIDRNELGMSMSYGFIALISLLMLCASNTASATAISSEGNEFVLLKTAPGKTSNIVWSKLLINLIISLVMTTLSFILLRIILIPDVDKGLLDPAKLVFIYFYVVIVECGLLLWSIQLDIVNPKLREYANAQNKNEIKNSSQSIFIGLVFSIIFTALMIVVFILGIPFFAKAIILMVVALIFLGLRFYFLLKYRDAFFEDIQL